MTALRKVVTDMYIKTVETSNTLLIIFIKVLFYIYTFLYECNTVQINHEDRGMQSRRSLSGIQHLV